ncbi:MAG TPA: HNH endonuclease signature motif containing protein, partial [Trebonia sp.]|nr:HNH endonuclease signature motif containing protein [Trebonia sp.]
DGGAGSPAGKARLRPRALPPEAWEALRYAIARLAVDLVSGPDGIASVLRRGLIAGPYNGKSVVLDVGYSTAIPGHIRRAVQLRAKGRCEWPGCQRRAAHCDIHHLVHKADGGPTSVSGCALLCAFHHDVCIHRRGWRLVLHPDATSTAYGPRGQLIRSHAPPAGKGPP